MNYIEFDLTEDYIEQSEGLLIDSIDMPQHSDMLHWAEHVSSKCIFEEDRMEFVSFFNRERILKHYYRGKKEAIITFKRTDSNHGIFWTEASIQIVLDPYSGVIKCFALFKDVDDRKKEEINLRRKSMYDSQTGMLRRESFIDQFSILLQKSMGSTDMHHLFIVLDIDDFKKINDTLGHVAGDVVLKTVSSNLKSNLSDSDILGRLGGDEFIIALEDVKTISIASRLTSMQQACGCNYQGMNVTCSLGAAAYPKDGISFDELYNKADSALYVAKAKGKATYSIYGEKN